MFFHQSLIVLRNSQTHTETQHARSTDITFIKYEILIGSDNGTRRISQDYQRKVIKWARRTFHGFFVKRGRGLDDGTMEDTLEIVVLADGRVKFSYLEERVRELKRQLRQHRILLTKSLVEGMEI